MKALKILGVSLFGIVGLLVLFYLVLLAIKAILAAFYIRRYPVPRTPDLSSATIVQPIKVVSTEGLWRGFDVKLVDGAVNGAGYFVSGVSVVLRLLQNGSVKTYAASMFVGAVAVLAYYLWR